MEAAAFSETLLQFCWTKRRHILEDESEF